MRSSAVAARSRRTQRLTVAGETQKRAAARFCDIPALTSSTIRRLAPVRASSYRDQPSGPSFEPWFLAESTASGRARTYPSIIHNVSGQNS